MLTRDGEGARRYVSALAELGLFTVPTPVTTTAPADAGDRARLAVACRSGRFDWILVASARAVAPLVEAGGPGRARVLAVGTATADALAARNVFAETSPVATGAGAAEELIARGARAVLVPRAQHGRDEAIERLQAADVEAVAVTAYRTTPRGADDPALAIGLDLIAHQRAAVIAVFAPSQVEALADLLAARGTSAAVLASSVIAAIGPTTAHALTERSIRVDAVAASPDPTAMASALAAVYPPR